MISKVEVSAISPEIFRGVIGDRYSEIERSIEAAERVLEGRAVWHVNSTAKGGGVAEMLKSLLAYACGARVDARWVTIDGDPGFFRVTKRIHNHLHGSPGDGGALGDAEREIYSAALFESAGELSSMVGDGDVVYLHDPQTAGMIAPLAERGIAVVWRCHVGVDNPNGLVRQAWEMLRPYVARADAYVFSREAFIWDGLDREKVWLVPPSIDAFSPKNQHLEPEAVSAILAAVGLGEAAGGEPAFLRGDGSPARVTHEAEIEQAGPLPAGVPVIAQVSRWDRLKDPRGVLECFVHHCDHPEAHLLLVGPSVAGVADDPEGAAVLAEVREHREALPGEVAARVHLVSLPMDDVEENGAMVNAIQRRADVVMQKSLAEGFGLTVAEAMWKAKPVVASRVGGIQDQIENGVSGVMVDDPADLQAVGAAVGGLLADPARAAEMGAAARERVLRDFLGTRHLVQYMGLLEELLDGHRG